MSPLVSFCYKLSGLNPLFFNNDQPCCLQIPRRSRAGWNPIPEEKQHQGPAGTTTVGFPWGNQIMILYSPDPWDQPSWERLPQKSSKREGYFTITLNKQTQRRERRCCWELQRGTVNTTADKADGCLKQPFALEKTHGIRPQARREWIYCSQKPRAAVKFPFITITC